MQAASSRACPIVVAIALATAAGSAGAAVATAAIDGGTTEAAAAQVVAPLPWLVVAGGAALLLCLADRIAGRRRTARVGVALAALLALIAVAHLAWTGKRHDLPGLGPVWSLDDDMMITLRYARNLAQGDGLVWNAGERVEGITNLLWALLLTPLHWLLSPARAAAGAIVLNGVLLLLLLRATARLAASLGGTPLGAGLAAVALATHQATLHWVVGGGESVLLALLIVEVATVALAPDRPTARAAVAAALLGGLAWSTRPDAVALLAPLLVRIAWRLRGEPSASSALLRFAVAALALPLAVTGFRLAYYGSPLPNTYWLKMTGWDGRHEAGFAYLAAGLRHHAGFIGAAVVGALLLRSSGAVALLAAIALHAGYVVHAGGDELPFERFLLPAVPLVLALGFAGATASWRRLSPPAAADSIAPSVPWRGLALGAALLAFGTVGGSFVPGTLDPAQASRSRAERANSMIGLLVRANTAQDALIAHFWAGSAAYFSERRGLDLLGKCDPVIARQEAKAGLMKPGHNKYDFAHSLALQPDVIVGGEGGAATLAFLKEKYLNPASPHHGYRAFADLYLHPDFASCYCRARQDDVGKPAAMPQLVGGMGSTLAVEYADVSRRFHGVFVRHGSTRAKPPAEWQTPAP